MQKCNLKILMSHRVVPILSGRIEMQFSTCPNRSIGVRSAKPELLELTPFA